MVRDELRAKLAALDETRAAAERELVTVRDRVERLEEFEREAEAVLEVYARVTPAALDALALEQRQQFYWVLGLRVTAHQDAPPEIDGTFVVDGPLGMPEPHRGLDTASGCWSRNTKLPELGFHAVLGDGSREVGIEWAPGQARCGR
jgi:hypothetical protein